MNRTFTTLTLVAAAGALIAHAQQPSEMIGYTSPVNIEFMSAPIAFDTEPVTGAPYSAEAVTEIVQQLADGNRIVRRNAAQVSRDSQGRTRREEGFAMFGPLVNGPRANEPRNVQISDPAAGTMMMLDLGTRTAHKMPGPPRLVLRNKIAAAGASAGANMVPPPEKIHVETFEVGVPGPNARGGVMFNRVEAAAAMRVEQPVIESLGTEFMEGIAVEGTRTTVTIPAGQIGNERPINITSERWFSPDLKILVMSRHSDPRFGETSYRLTNLDRAEPAAHLFEIPADFKVIEPGANHNVIIERKLGK